VVLDGVSGNAMELLAEIDTKHCPVIAMKVLRAPGQEEFTRITYYRYGGIERRRRNGKRFRDSVVTIDSSRSTTLGDVGPRPPETAPVAIAPGEPLKLQVFLDRSIVEVFVNGKQCIAVRVYPGREDSLGVSLRAQGRDATLKSLDAWQMKSIYPTHKP
jgi:beta-fructofuranosidase